MTNHSIDKDILSNTINNNNNNNTSTKNSTKTVRTVTDDTTSMDCQQQQHEQSPQQEIRSMNQQQEQLQLKVENELFLDQAVISSDNNIVTNTTSSTTYTKKNNNNNEFVLPKLIYPPSKELEPILIFTAKAVYEQHYGIPLTNSDSVLSTTAPPNNTSTNNNNKGKINTSYRALIDTFQYSKTQEPTLVRNILLSLAISGNGRTLDLITSTSNSTSTSDNTTTSTTTEPSNTNGTTAGTGTLKHARLIHQILLFNPFSIQIVNKKNNTNTKSEMEEIDKNNNDDSSVVATAIEANNNNDSSTNNDDEQTPQDHSIVYAYIHLLLAFVTKNTSILLQPTIQTIWKLLATKSTPKSDTSDITSASTSTNTNYDTITYCLHSLLATIVRIVPESTSYISNIVLTSSYVPTKYTSDKYIIQYYKLCWIVVQYIPSLCSNIYKLIINTCIEMDVEIIIQDSGVVTLDTNKNDTDNNIDNITITKDDESIKTYTTATTTATTTGTNKKSITTEGVVTVQQNETNVAIAKGTTQNKQQERIKQLANKLDLIMLLLFEQTEQFVSIDNTNTDTNSSTNTTIIQLYDIISSIFENVVLVTHKSKFVQFLLLHLCGLQMRVLEQQRQQNKKQPPEGTIVPFEKTMIDNNPDTTISVHKREPDQQDQEQPEQEDDSSGTVLLYREFAAKLIEIILDPTRATIIRQTSACYLASFVCRAQYVTIQTICESLEALIRWSEAYIESIDINQNDIYHPMHTITDTKERCAMYALFYTVVQSALYIMCFNGYEIHQYYEEISNDNTTNMENNSENPLEYIKVGAERWSTICCHWLQPLRYCLESVRSEFLQISKQYKLLDDSTYEKLIVEEEKRLVGIQQLSVVRKHLQRRNSWYTRKVRRSYEKNTVIALVDNEINTPEQQQQQQIRRRKLLRRSNSSMSISTIATSISVGTTLRNLTATPSSATTTVVVSGAGTGTGTTRLVSSSGTSVCNASVSTVGLETERHEGGVGGLGQGTNPLDSFFPFDPYLLRLSHDYVDPYYRHWTSHNNDDDMMDDDDEYDNDGDNNDNNSDNESNNNNEDDDDESYDEEMVGTEVHAAFDREDASTIADNNSVMPSDDEEEDSVDIQVEKIDYGNVNIDNQSIMEDELQQDEDDNQSSLASDNDDDDDNSVILGGSIDRRRRRRRLRGIMKSAHSVDGVGAVAVAGTTTNNNNDDDENSEYDDDDNDNDGVQEHVDNNQDDIVSFDNVTQQNNFIQLLKRPRAPSMETGSW